MSVYDGMWELDEPVSTQGITLKTQPITATTPAIVFGNIVYLGASVHFKDLKEVCLNIWKTKLLLSSEDGRRGQTHVRRPPRPKKRLD